MIETIKGELSMSDTEAIVTDAGTAPDCSIGEARLTDASQFPGKYIIHTAGPIWQGGESNEASLLAACYQNSLKTAAEHGIRTIAFPSVSTGVSGYPVQEAARVAVNAVTGFLQKHPGKIDRILWVLPDERTEFVYRQVISQFCSVSV